MKKGAFFDFGAHLAKSTTPSVATLIPGVRLPLNLTAQMIRDSQLKPSPSVAQFEFWKDETGTLYPSIADVPTGRFATKVICDVIERRDAK